MASNAISGVDGDVKISGTQIAEITKWDLTLNANVPGFVSNQTAGYEETVAGKKSGTLTLEGCWDPGDLAYTVIEPGTLVTLDLYINDTQFWGVPARITQFKTGANREGEPVMWTAEAKTHGAWTPPVEAMTLPPDLVEGMHLPSEAQTTLAV